MGHEIARLIFATIRTTAEKNGGVVTVDQISKLQRMLEGCDSQLSPKYESNFNACMACIENAGVPEFRSPQLLRFCLTSLTREAMPRIGMSRQGAGQKKWVALICRAIADRMGSFGGAPVEEALVKAYYELAQDKRGDLRTSDLLHDSRTASVVSELLERVKEHLQDNPEFGVGLCQQINKRIAATTAAGTSRAYAVSVHEITTLLRALRLPGQAEQRLNGAGATSTNAAAAP